MKIPILMYHKVGAPVTVPRDRTLNVSAQAFARQMSVLQRMGYECVTFDQALDGLFHGKSLPRKPVCVTFDDGYQCVADFAAPLLGGMDWPASVFVPTAFVGGSNSWDEAYGSPILPIMDWPTLQRIRNSGWELSGHTRTHPHLDKLSDNDSLEEMAGGKREIKERTGAAVRTFCYPFGSVGPRTPLLCRDAGFIGACTTRSGIAQTGMDPFLLPRVKIAYRDEVWGLLYRLLIRPYLPR